MLDLNALFSDPDPALFEERPDMYSLRIPAVDGSTLLGVCLTPGGRRGERHPAVLLLHGFPGNEQNRDLAQDLRRAGMVTVFFHYRGNWGSGGEYALAHLPEDAAVVLDYLRAHADELGIDTDRLFLIGHSMGGFTTLNLLADHAPVRGAVCIAPCDIAGMYLHERAAFDGLTLGTEPYFRMDSPRSFADECAAHAESWPFPLLAARIDPQLPLLLVNGTRDSIFHHHKPLLDALIARGARVSSCTLDDDHCFSASRCAMTSAIARWIDGILEE